MYLAFVLAELAGLLLLIMISWIAGSKASRLVYSPSGAMLYRKAGKRLFWAGFLAVTAAAVMTVMALMIRSFDPVIWQDRAYLHGPLIAVPVLSVLLLSIPKLLRLRKETKPEPEDQPPAPHMRALAADPGLVVPFQASALAALTAFYFAWTPPVPFRWTDGIPLLLFLLAVIGLWGGTAAGRTRPAGPKRLSVTARGRRRCSA
ncbi:hypothetical protein LJK88_18470 [Paenibacillus sp. P26]|nr:hypothetical protein LJK88_18470 [Paenibacillus sp. P26]